MKSSRTLAWPRRRANAWPAGALGALALLSSCAGAQRTERSPDAPEAKGSSPTAAVGGRLAAGRDFTCAVREGAHVYCWGRNQRGQIGNGTVADAVAAPVLVGELEGVTSLSAGGEHACALDNDKRASCWGDDDSALDTRHSVRSLPVGLPRSFGRIEAISAGGNHTCAITEQGTAACMGWGSDGQIGDGAATQRSNLRAVFGLDSKVVSIAAGEVHTCAITVDSRVWCWGSARFGRLGTGLTQQYAFRMAPDVVPTVRAGRVVAGGVLTCALTLAGGVSCWGRRTPGRVKYETDVLELQATPFIVPGLERDVHSVAVGEAHACAIRVRGEAVCWGWNELGQLGDGTTTDSERPLPVRGIPEPVWDITAGRGHTCARGTSGSVYCWGDGSFGQLGTGARTSSLVPVRVEFPEGK